MSTLGWVHHADLCQKLVGLPWVTGWHHCIIGPWQVPGDTLGHIGGQAHVALQQAVAEGVVPKEIQLFFIGKQTIPLFWINTTDPLIRTEETNAYLIYQDI